LRLRLDPERDRELLLLEDRLLELEEREEVERREDDDDRPTDQVPRERVLARDPPQSYDCPLPPPPPARMVNTSSQSKPPPP
jgi:hypothetical protein